MKIVEEAVKKSEDKNKRNYHGNHHQCSYEMHAIIIANTGNSGHRASNMCHRRFPN